MIELNHKKRHYIVKNIMAILNIGYIAENDGKIGVEICRYNFLINIDNYLTRKYNASIRRLLKKYR